MVQSTGKTTSSTEQLLQLSNATKASANTSKDDASNFDKMIEKGLEQGTDVGSGKDTGQGKDTGVTEDVTDPTQTAENPYPQVVFQWMTTMPGQYNMAMQVAQASQAAQVVGGLPVEEPVDTAALSMQADDSLLGTDETKQLLVQEPEGANKQPAAEGNTQALPGVEVEANKSQGVQQAPKDELGEDVQTGKSIVLDDEADVLLKKEVSQEVQPKTDIGQTTESKAETKSETPQKSDAVHVSQPIQVDTSPSTSVKAPAQQSASTYASKPEYMEQVGDKLAKQMASGKREFEIQLEPMHLGKMMIKVTYEAGRAAVSIICSEAKTMQAMSQNAKELGGIIENHLGTQTQIIVDKGQQADYLEQGHQQERERQDQEAQQNNKEKDNDAMETFDFLQQLRLGLL